MGQARQRGGERTRGVGVWLGRARARLGSAERSGACTVRGVCCSAVGAVVGAAAAAFACSRRARQRQPAAPFLPMQTAQSLGGTMSLPQAFRRPGVVGPDWPRQLTQVSSVEGRAVEVVVPLLPRVRRRHQTDRRPAGPCMVWIRE